MENDLNPIVAFRKEHGITQTEFGAPIGVNASCVSKWERGRINAERVIDIETAWGKMGLTRHSLRPDLYGDPSTLPQTCVQKKHPEGVKNV